MYISISPFLLLHRAWARTILILMTMKDLYRIALMMVLLFVCQVSVKAVVVFKAGTDRVVNGTITKDGISISGLGIYENYDFEEMPTSFGTSDMTVSSTVGNIVMIGFCYSPFDFYEGGATNSWQGDYGKDFSPHPKRISNFTNQIQVDASVGSFEEGVWRGASSSVHFNFNHTEYLEALYVYLEGDMRYEKCS